MTADLWSDYWGADRTPGSTDAFPEVTRAAIVDRWRRVFGALAAGSRILDVGTGAGALARLAADGASAECPLVVLGVDLATTVPANPAAPLAHCTLGFRGGVDSTDLPWGDRSWTAVVSQFALEYADFDEALAEAARVCAGRLVLLVHAADGVLVRQNAAIAGQIDWLLDELSLAGRLAAHVRGPTEATTGALLEVGRAMTARIAATDNPSFLQALARDLGLFLSGPAPDASDGLARVSDLAAALGRHRRRMRALAAAGRDPPALDRACEGLRRSGFPNAHWEPQVAARRAGGEPHLVGYWLEASRPPEQV